MAQSNGTKGNLPGDPATSGALAVVFFLMTLVLCFEGNAIASLRASLGPHPLAVVGLSSVATPPVSHTPTPLAITSSPRSASQFDTPVPVLATVNAIATEHALSLTDISQPTSMSTPVLLTETSPTASDTTPTADVAGASILPSVSATRAATSTPKPFLSTATNSAGGKPTPPARPTSASAVVAPVLIGSRASAESIVLTWSYPGQLEANDYFNLRIWQDGQPPNDIANVQATTYTISGNLPAGTYNWTIAVIHKQAGQFQLISVAARTLRFAFPPAGSGGGPSSR